MEQTVGMQPNDGLQLLAESRERFLSFVKARIRDPSAAEEVLQASLLKAAEGIGGLKESDRLISWFYAILRNAITDAHRRRGRLTEVELLPELDVAEDNSVERQICECFLSLLPTLRPEYANLIDRLDLSDEPAATEAARLGITPNNLKVRHHRARRALRRRLEETCRVCAEHHCLDCTCQAD